MLGKFDRKFPVWTLVSLLRRAVPQSRCCSSWDLWDRWDVCDNFHRSHKSHFEVQKFVSRQCFLLFADVRSCYLTCYLSPLITSQYSCSEANCHDNPARFYFTAWKQPGTDLLPEVGGCLRPDIPILPAVSEQGRSHRRSDGAGRSVGKTKYCRRKSGIGHIQLM